MRERDEVGALLRCSALLVAIFTVGLAAAGQDPSRRSTAVDIVADVRAAMASGGLISGEQTLNSFRASHGAAPEALEALSWLARGALTARQFDHANRYARETRELARSALTGASGNGRQQLLMALESSIEVLAGVLVEQGARSDAIHLLLDESATYAGTPIGERIRENITLLSLEGTPAPALEPGVPLGSRSPAGTGRIHQPTLLFFWAHWCADCKAESPILARLVERYGPRGLAVIAPTRRYGYVQAGRNAPPEKELRHLLSVRNTFYPFLKRAWVPVTETNHKAYGVAAIPMHVLVDRDGIIRLYRPGRMSEADLDAAIRIVVDR